MAGPPVPSPLMNDDSAACGDRWGDAACGDRGGAADDDPRRAGADVDERYAGEVDDGGADRVDEGRAESAGSRRTGCAAPSSAEHGHFVAELFAHYRRPLLRYLAGLLGGQADAEDVAQEAYARLLRTPALEPTPARARAYLFRVATNLVRDRFRRREQHAADDAQDRVPIDPADEPERIVDFEQGLDEIRRALLDLKPRCREVFLLRAADGLEYDAIAERLRVSRRTVEREMKHALDVCQQRLKRAWK